MASKTKNRSTFTGNITNCTYIGNITIPSIDDRFSSSGRRKDMNTKNYKVYTMTLAIIIATSFSLASVARAASSSGTSSTGSTTSQTGSDRSAKWYQYSTGSNPLTGTSWSTGSYGPDFGFGQTGSFTNTYSPWTGPSSTGTGEMTYAGGPPIYTGAGSLFQNINYGPLTSYVDTMSGMGGYGGYGGYYGGYGGYGLYGGYGGYGGYSPYGGYGLYGGGYGLYGGYGGYGLYGIY